MLEKVSKDFEGLHTNAFAFTGQQFVDYPEQTKAAEATLSQLCTGKPPNTLQTVNFTTVINKSFE